MSELTPAVLAMLLASALAVLAFVPFVAISYRRRGTLTLAWSVGSLAVLTYALGLFAYVLIPFPDSDDYRCVPAQLDPLQGLRDVADAPGHPTLLTNPALAQLVLNVALFVPFGFLLRTVLRRGWAWALAGGALVSLFIETTQLTGIWGLYPCAYRVFDVDDLITNTLGAVLGSLVALPFARRSRAQSSPAAPRPVTHRRRLLGMFIDYLALVVTSGVVATGTAAIDIAFGGPGGDQPYSTIGAAAGLLLHLAVGYATGSTLGEHAVLLRADEHRRPLWLTRSIRLASGIGGYAALTLAGDPFTWIAGLLALVAVGSVLFARSPLGLPARLAGQSIEDARQPTT